MTKMFSSGVSVLFSFKPFSIETSSIQEEALFNIEATLTGRIADNNAIEIELGGKKILVPISSVSTIDGESFNCNNYIFVTNGSELWPNDEEIAFINNGKRVMAAISLKSRNEGLDFFRAFKIIGAYSRASK